MVATEVERARERGARNGERERETMEIRGFSNIWLNPTVQILYA